jgi:hypothetical protein
VYSTPPARGDKSSLELLQRALVLFPARGDKASLELLQRALVLFPGRPGGYAALADVIGVLPSRPGGYADLLPPRVWDAETTDRGALLQGENTGDRGGVDENGDSRDFLLGENNCDSRSVRERLYRMALTCTEGQGCPRGLCGLAGVLAEGGDVAGADDLFRWARA